MEILEDVALACFLIMLICIYIGFMGFILFSLYQLIKKDME